MINWGDFSKYRNQLFGIAIISIVFLHYCQGLKNQSFLTIQYQNIVASIGVEIFVFLSGMGLFYSMSKNNKVISFYKRRFVRIIPTYLLVSIVTLALHDFFYDHGGIKAFLDDIFFVTYITKGMSLYWFVGFIICMYLIYPVLHSLFTGVHRDRWFIVLMVASFGLIFVTKMLFPVLFLHITHAINRIPVFILGSYCGSLIKENKPVTKLWLIGFILGLILIISNIVYSILTGDTLPIPRKPSNLFTVIPLMIILISLIKLVDKRTRIVSSICSWFGAISLELYVIHVSLRVIFSDLGIGTSTFLTYGIMAVIAVLLSVGVKKLVDAITKGSLSTSV